ncbi:MAG TPA: hypothetical protein VGM96_21145 [Reyranella sp.]|jgi:hypothetical protein
MKRLLFFLAVLAVPSLALAEDEPQVFNAFAVVRAEGTLVRAAEKQVSLAGALNGPLFVETDEGPVEAGTMACSLAVRFDQVERSQNGKGACTFSAADGAAAWADWECAGYDYVGCRGKMTINGGSGRFAGIRGEGTMIWRPSLHQADLKPDGSSALVTSGLVIWRGFKLTRSAH